MVGMVSAALGMSRNVYLTTRSRPQFMEDMQASLASSLLPIEVVASIVGGDSKPLPPPAPAQPSSDRIEPSNIEGAMREQRSKTVYPWFRRKAGRNYNVHNLDTRNVVEFKAAARAMGAVLDRRGSDG
jgi:hypothetical protein